MSLGWIPRLRLIEELEEWGELVELVGGEHNGALVLLVPAERILPGPARGEARPPRRVQRRIAHDEFEAPRRARRAISEVDQSKSVASKHRADRLLESLLDDGQLESWRTCRRFWVSTAYGDVELGRFGRLAFQRRDGARFTLCVVPTSYRDLPEGDIWTNLLLALKSSPERFFEVANYSAGDSQWRRGPVPYGSAR